MAVLGTPPWPARLCAAPQNLQFADLRGFNYALVDHLATPGKAHNSEGIISEGIMLKRGLVILVVVLIVLAIIGLLLPRNIHVERSVNIERPASLIFRLGASAVERCLAQQVLGGAADTICLDGGGEFDAHSHRLRDLG
jgi:hypothetical protein